MRRLLKYLKPYTLLIIFSVIFLFIQANADLALPDYLSRIVNNGIQQNGVENAVPAAIRQTEMEKLLIFMDDEDAGFVLEAYQLISPGTTDAEVYLEVYPALENEAIYVLSDLDQSQIDTLNPVLGKALVAVAGIQKIVDDPSGAVMFGEDFEFDPSRIPPGMDIFQALSMMPMSQRTEFNRKNE